MRKILAFILLATIIVGCKDEPSQSDIDDQIIQEYLKDKGITAQKDPSGLYYKIIKQGTGRFNVYSIVDAKYKGYLTDGSVFDASSTKFDLRAVIAGWQIGIPKVGNGGSIQLFIPSGLGYGSKWAGSIPPNSVLVFDVEVKSFYPY